MLEPQHVSRVGNELIVVYVYGARNLPALPNGSPPTPFVFVYVHATRRAAHPQPTHSAAQRCTN